MVSVDENRLDQIVQKLDELVEDNKRRDAKFDKLELDLVADNQKLNDKFDKLVSDNEKFSDKLDKSNDKFDTYQKATQWVVQLAFSLIASATVTVILTSVLRR
jgi:predicted nuclease with TOPRIM domain